MAARKSRRQKLLSLDARFNRLAHFQLVLGEFFSLHIDLEITKFAACQIFMIVSMALCVNLKRAY